jgi:hypothetical protein
MTVPPCLRALSNPALASSLWGGLGVIKGDTCPPPPVTKARLRHEEHLYWKSSVSWLPQSILADEGVGEHDELAHDGGDGDFEQLSSGT